ncbi:hypothetical protein EJ110_NYTH53566 [Nymphaea thermarum]|nr:hypothetical protein EJ110_NYTH53566 [Nymphaea thermarum]
MATMISTVLLNLGKRLDSRCRATRRRSLIEKDIQRSLIEEEVLASQYNLRSAKGKEVAHSDEMGSSQDLQGIVGDDLQIKTAAMLLEGDAVAWWRRKRLDIQKGICTIDTFDDFQRELKTYFMPPNAMRHAYRMVGELKHTGSLRDYMRAYQRLMLDVPDMQEQDKLNWFILGLQSWAQSEVERSNPGTLEDAYVVAERLADTQRKSYTNAFKPSKKPDHGGKKDDRREQKDEPSTQHQAERRTFFRKSDNSQNRVTKCWFCDGNHLARQCPKRINRDNQASSSRHSANAAQVEGGDAPKMDIQRSLIEEEVLASQYNLRSAKGKEVAHSDEMGSSQGQEDLAEVVRKLVTDVTTHEEALGNAGESFGQMKDEVKGRDSSTQFLFTVSYFLVIKNLGYDRQKDCNGKIVEIPILCTTVTSASRISELIGYAPSA